MVALMSAPAPSAVMPDFTAVSRSPSFSFDASLTVRRQSASTTPVRTAMTSRFSTSILSLRSTTSLESPCAMPALSSARCISAGDGTSVMLFAEAFSSVMSRAFGGSALVASGNIGGWAGGASLGFDSSPPQPERMSVSSRNRIGIRMAPSFA